MNNSSHLNGQYSMKSASEFTLYSLTIHKVEFLLKRSPIYISDYECQSVFLQVCVIVINFPGYILQVLHLHHWKRLGCLCVIAILSH